MNRFKSENEKYIVDYLDMTEEICPELTDLFYPITVMAIDYLCVFEEILSEDLQEFDYDEMDIRDTIRLVREFLGKMDKKYLVKFDKAMADGTIDIFHIDNLEESDERIDEPISLEGDKHVNINIPINYTVQDGAIIIHEFVHFTNSDKGIGVREIFTELISIYMELRYYQFLAEKGYNINSYYQELYERLNNVFDAANNIAYSGSVLDIYHNTGDLNRQNIKFMDKFRMIYEDNVEHLINFSRQDDFGQSVYEFGYDTSYLLGGIIAVNLLKETKVNDIKIKYINENLDKLSITEILNIFNVDINNFTELIDYCAYIIKSLEGVIYEDNSNSRSNRSR